MSALPFPEPRHSEISLPSARKRGLRRAPAVAFYALAAVAGQDLTQQASAAAPPAPEKGSDLAVATPDAAAVAAKAPAQVAIAAPETMQFQEFTATTVQNPVLAAIEPAAIKPALAPPENLSHRAADLQLPAAVAPAPRESDRAADSQLKQVVAPPEQLSDRPQQIQTTAIQPLRELPANYQFGDRPLELPPPTATAANSTLPANTTETSPAPTSVQPTTFPDIQGHWAQTFIEGLAQRDIVRGYPDGYYRPNDLITRAEFSSVLAKAFPLPPKRAVNQFADVPANHWAQQSIQTAYRAGFLSGYPNNLFYPDQNLTRIQTLVAVTSGLDLKSTAVGSSKLESYFQDATAIPDYARSYMAAALENRLVVNHPEVAVFNPNAAATRADVAAVIYQALVKQGKAPAVSATDPAAPYIVGYQPPTASTLPPEQISSREELRLPDPPVVETYKKILAGGASISTPTAFGADGGDTFVGLTYQSRARYTNLADAGIALGFGLGDELQSVGLETTITSFSTFRQGFGKNGGISFKAHHTFPDSLALAVGVENAISWGNPDAGSSVYGVASKVFQLQENIEEPFSSLTVSLGLGGGRFRSEQDVRNGVGSVNLFGSVGLRVVEPISLIAEWSGQDLNLGAAITPFPNVPLVITPAIADVTRTAGDGARFILGVGYGISF